jgi:DNA-damage-inducible protein D
MPNELLPSPPEGHQSPFARIRRTSAAGVEFWSSRDFAQVLGYADYRNFEQVIQKARTACFNSAHPVEDHFVEITEMVPIGSGAMRPVQTVYLSRYACYLVVQNADPGKEIVALGQTYFAIQTRRQELTDQATETDRRLLLRTAWTGRRRKKPAKSPTTLRAVPGVRGRCPAAAALRPARHARPGPSSRDRRSRRSAMAGAP